MRPFCCASTLSVSLLVLWPPLLLLLLHSHHQLVGHTHFHAHTWSSSDVRGAVIYGARSLSVYAGNSNTHGRTAGKERRGEEGAPGCSPLLTFTFLSNAHTYFLHFFFSLFSCLFLTNFFLKCMCNGGGGCTWHSREGLIYGRCRQGPTERGRKYMKTLLFISHLLIADFIAPPPSASLQPITTNCFVHFHVKPFLFSYFQVKEKKGLDMKMY